MEGSESVRPRRGRSPLNPERLWLASIALQRRGHRRLAKLLKNVNSAIYHNSLPPGASVSDDVELGHHGFGTVIHTNVVIGRRVKIWHNVTIAVRAGARSPYRIVIEDDVKIGANSVIISPYRRNLTIGRGARIGAGAVVSRDVAPGSTVIGAPSKVIEPDDERAVRRVEAPAVRGAELGAVAPDARLGEVESDERAQEALRDDDVDPRLRSVVDPAAEP